MVEMGVMLGEGSWEERKAPFILVPRYHFGLCNSHHAPE